MNRNVLKVSSIQKNEIESIRFLRSSDATSIQPFIGSDTTVGMEYELQVAVEGQHEDVDLPLKIKNSNYYKNIVKRAGRGDLPTTSLDDLEAFLHDNKQGVWENSWVRLSPDLLSPDATRMLANDLLADKRNTTGSQRSDVARFYCSHKGEEKLRLPISYLLKLALANAISDKPKISEELALIGKKLLSNFTSDNTSPEILSFSVARAGRLPIGEMAANETARTYAICQLLIQYANSALGLESSGQKCHLYFAPHAPARQKKLNELVPDGFYRHLFMSPCLSGWDKGEEKSQYMGLCHKTLSRSQLNTINKLKDAGIITNNLITLPNTSNTCLANNGIHVSLGSNLLSEMRRNNITGFTAGVEKYLGDLVIKIVEHFLPLFAGIYSAAPYRIDFRDFHPENVLGFLPHELDYTHLRMIWRRWKKKANLGFLGRSFTPFGPRWVDLILARLFCLRGDIVPDFRLIDYLVCLLSTESCPGLNGACENHDKLKEELMDMGVFDTRMAIYLLYRQRQYAQSGYCGFEGRSYSLFPSISDDMKDAVDMQNLITALAYRYVLKEEVCHHDIPDEPTIESERRQIFFGSAIGIPTFYVRANSGNRFLKKILHNVTSIRKSNRYRGYLRVKNNEYRQALIKLIRQDGADLIKNLQVEECLQNLEERIFARKETASATILAGVRKMTPYQSHPLKINADTFNRTAEEFFRTELKEKHFREGLDVLIDDCRLISAHDNFHLDKIMKSFASDISAVQFVAENRDRAVSGSADIETIRRLLWICLAIIHHQQSSEDTL